eukprot:1767805-Rhodomonas_salina.2
MRRTIAGSGTSAPSSSVGRSVFPGPLHAMSVPDIVYADRRAYHHTLCQYRTSRTQVAEPTITRYVSTAHRVRRSQSVPFISVKADAFRTSTWTW